MRTDLLPISDPNALAWALEVLASGGLVAFPTDTVYGLGALVSDEKAVASIDLVKDRRAEKAIPVLIGEYSQLSLVSNNANAICKKLARRFWPGPLTIVVPRHPSIPNVVTPYPTVAVRVPGLAATQELLRLTGPMAVTSANLSGMPSLSTAQDVMKQLGGRIPLILDGGFTPGGIPSTIVDCTHGEPVILREGLITLEQILNALA